MAKRTAKSVRLVQTIPRADFHSDKKLTKRLKSARFTKDMSMEEAEKLAALVVKVRAGEVSAAEQEAVIFSSMKAILGSPFKKEWEAFFKRHGDTSLISIDFNEFDRPWVFLPFPSVKAKRGKAEAKFNFAREGKEVVVDIHLTDAKGKYVGTVRKAVAPAHALIGGGKGKQQARDVMTRMVTAGIQRHAKDVLGEAHEIDPSQIGPPDVAWELNVLLTPLDVVRGQAVYLDFAWPKGIPVRTLFGELNKKRMLTVSGVIKDNWNKRFDRGRPGFEARQALSRITDILREQRGYNARQIREAFGRALGNPVSFMDFEELMYELE